VCTLIFSPVNKKAAAGFSIVGFGVTRSARALLAEADGFDLVAVDAQQVHHAGNRVGTTLAQGQVVFRAATGVGIAFDANLLLRVAREIRGVHFHQAAILLRHGVAVELEIDRALLR
jgi:hypothetical protein